MKIFLILMQVLFSYSAFSLEKAEVLRELNNGHGPQWDQVIKDGKQIKKIKSILTNIIESPDSFKNEQYNEDDLELIRKNAMIQLGHFVTNSQGFMGDQQVKWYQKYLNKEEGIDSYAIQQSLANSGTHEGIEMLISQAKKTNSSQVFKLIKKSLYGNEERDKAPLGIFPDYPKIGGNPKIYAPNISVPYYQRAGNAWPKTIWNVRKAVSDTMRQQMQTQKPDNFLVQLGTEFSQRINEDFNFFKGETQEKFHNEKLINSTWKQLEQSSVQSSVQSSEIIEESDSNKDKGKKPASIDDPYENKDSNISILSLSLLFAILMLGFFARKFL